jgi:hypothetical protein
MRALRGRATVVAIATAIVGLGIFAASATLAYPSGPGRRDSSNLPSVRSEGLSVDGAAQVEGAVVDREGAGVAGATVIARPVGLPVTLGVAARVFEAVTDSRGRFRLDGLPPGTYWFVAFHATSAGSSPAIPVVDKIEIAIRLDDEQVRS